MKAQDSGVHHVTFRVSDLERSRKFYQEVLGFEVEVLPDRLRFAAGETRILLREPLTGTAPDDRFSEYRIDLDHMAFSVGERAKLERLVERLRASGVNTRGIQEYEDPHGRSKRTEFVCFRDPDNIQLEFWLA